MPDYKIKKRRFVVGLGRVVNRDVAPMLDQIKICLRYRLARCLYTLVTYTTLLNVSFSLNWSNPKYRSIQFLKKNQMSSVLQLFYERIKFAKQDITTAATDSGCIG